MSLARWVWLELTPPSTSGASLKVFPILHGKSVLRCVKTINRAERYLAKIHHPTQTKEEWWKTARALILAHPDHKARFFWQSWGGEGTHDDILAMPQTPSPSV